jgi:hypothetical protein
MSTVHRAAFEASEKRMALIRSFSGRRVDFAAVIRHSGDIQRSTST